MQKPKIQICRPQCGGEADCKPFKSASVYEGSVCWGLVGKVPVEENLDLKMATSSILMEARLYSIQILNKISFLKAP